MEFGTSPKVEALAAELHDFRESQVYPAEPVFAAISATDFEGGVEFVTPFGGAGGLGAKLAEHGAGQICPLVFDLADIDEAREFVASKGFRIRVEYDSTKGNAD